VLVSPSCPEHHDPQAVAGIERVGLVAAGRGSRQKGGGDWRWQHGSRDRHRRRDGNRHYDGLARHICRTPAIHEAVDIGGERRLRRNGRHRRERCAGAAGGGYGDRQQNQEAAQPHRANPDANQRVNGVSPYMVKKASPE
jgi:hypothetical protein